MPSRKRKVLFLLALVAIASVSAGCKKRPGSSCPNEREAECQSPMSAIMCQKGTWRELACRGPKGCVTQGGSVDCDQTLATTGDPCEAEGNVACSVDRSSALKCDHGKWDLAHPCSKGCSVRDNLVECD